jgi:hypothetical protein
MIKKYLEYILENNNIGEYIEKLSMNHDFIKSMASEYTKSLNPNIRMSNAINTLSKSEKDELMTRVERYLSDHQGNVDVTTSTPIDLDGVEKIEESWGKNVLNSFFKSLTALGFKDNQTESKTIPSEFLIFFKFNDVNVQSVKEIFSRYKSLSTIEIDYDKNTIGLYFGIKTDLTFEYGYYHDNLIPIGVFKLNKSTLNGLKTSQLKATSGLKKSITDLSVIDIKILGMIKEEMSKFNPGFYSQKSTPVVDDRMITFGYYGWGKWEMGNLDESDLIKLKADIKNFLQKYKWSDGVLVNITPSQFWCYINIKLK